MASQRNLIAIVGKFTTNRPKQRTCAHARTYVPPSTMRPKRMGGDGCCMCVFVCVYLMFGRASASCLVLRAYVFRARARSRECVCVSTRAYDTPCAYCIDWRLAINMSRELHVQAAPHCQFMYMHIMPLHNTGASNIQQKNTSHTVDFCHTVCRHNGMHTHATGQQKKSQHIEEDQVAVAPNNKIEDIRVIALSGDVFALKLMTMLTGHHDCNTLYLNTLSHYNMYTTYILTRTSSTIC